MKGRRILVAVFLLTAIGAGYMSLLLGRAGDSGKWLFGVFSLFFLFLAVVPLVPELKRKPEPVRQTRFVPHWFMLLAMLVVILGILAAISGAVLRR